MSLLYFHFFFSLFSFFFLFFSSQHQHQQTNPLDPLIYNVILLALEFSSQHNRKKQKKITAEVFEFFILF